MPFPGSCLRQRKVSKMELIYSRVEAEVDLDAIRWNLREMKKNMQPGAKICAVVKADA